MYSIRHIGCLDLIGQYKVNRILYDCGKDMAHKYNLHHWDNSYFKNSVIIALCELKNKVYLVTEQGKPVATFQTRQEGDTLHFQKLASSPRYAGKGIGTFCMNQIEAMAKATGCTRVSMEVYASSQHAVDFYLHRGYHVCGETRTRKYSELKMEKVLR